MSRYIDAERIKQKKRFDSAKQRYMVWMSDIYQAPSIDIVRCGECIDNDEGWCLHFGYDIEPTDFCSYGERRE